MAVLERFVGGIRIFHINRPEIIVVIVLAEDFASEK